MAKWFWKNDEGEFVAFTTEGNRVLEEAYNKQGKTGMVKLHISGRHYSFSFDKMTQKNLSSGKIRELSRKPVVKKVPMWQWESGENSWTFYSSDDSKAIEQAYQNEDLKLDITLETGHDVTVHFGHMTQINKKTKGVRGIQRKLVLPKEGSPKALAKVPSAAGFLTSMDMGKSVACVKKERDEDEDTTPPSKKTKGIDSERKHGDVVDNWGKVESVLVLPGNVKGSSCIIGFDLDDTLVTTKSGKVHASGATDWKWLCPEVPKLLQRLDMEGKKIVIFSNQSGIAKNEARAKDLKKKILALSHELGFSIQAFLSMGGDRFRKPATGLWDLMEEKFNDGVKVDRSSSWYVGDAAGRIMTTLAGRARDFSCSDRKFAANLGVSFSTPEEYFKGAKPEKFNWGFNPKLYKFASTPTEDGAKAFHKETQEVVLFVGCPASGKSTFAKRYFIPHGYIHINRDTLKTKEKCFKALDAALSAGKSAIVDNTNPGTDARSPYIKIAKKHGVPIRAFYFDLPEDLAHHLNRFRQLDTAGAISHIPPIAYNTYRGAFRTPVPSEGFSEVLNVHFVPHFSSATSRDLFYQFLP